MRIATWNINSVRLRIGLLNDLMTEMQPDVICLQETKTHDDTFPFSAIKKMGYEHLYFNGMKSYNGVAILSKLPFENAVTHDRLGNNDSRHISVDFKFAGQARPISLHCIYIPAGGDEPDRNINPKFAHKLDFLDELNNWFSRNYTKDDHVIAVGDFNIAPHENDVWSHKQLLKVVSHTPVEIEKLTHLQQSLGWIDTARHFIPDDEKAYSWWSYRNRDWKKSNRGRRLDHIWVTPALKDYLASYKTMPHARDWIKPSDHVPVIVDLQDIM